MKRLVNKKIGIAFSVAMMSPSSLFAIDRSEVSSKVLYRAVDQLTDYLAEDMNELANHTKKTAVVNFTLSEELPPSIQHYLVKKLEMAAQKDKKTPVQFVQCVECLSLHAVAEGDEIFIRKGITDETQLATTMDKLGINKYSDINLAYTGDELVMQVAVVDKNKMVDWSNEYKTPYKAYEDSQWELGVAAELGSFQGGAGLPATKGAKVNFGQRLVGFGSAGLMASYHDKQPGLPSMTSVATYLSVSHNEIFNQYWNFVRLNYETSVGVTDFNGNQMLQETIGVKTILGKHYSVGIHGKFHQFASKKPNDDAPIENPEGEPYLRNNEVLPTMISLTLGAEFL